MERSSIVAGFALVISAAGGLAGLAGLFTIKRTNQKLAAESELNSANAENVRANAGVVVSAAALEQMKAAIESSDRERAKVETLVASNDQLEARVDALEHQLRQIRRASEEHRIWDQDMILEIRTLGGLPSDPPPLLPITL